MFTHLWLALFGLWSWERVPALPPEMILLPPWVPLNVYDFACWARQTIVALSIVKAHRPVRPLPFDLSELHVGHRAAGAGARDGRLRAARGRARVAWRGWTALLRAYERRPLRAAAPARARAGRALDRAPPGGRRLLGRDPAAVGVLADGAAPRAAIRSSTR